MKCASSASEENFFVKLKCFMLSEGILEAVLQEKPCLFKFRKQVNATNSLSVYISNKPTFYMNWTFLLGSGRDSRFTGNHLYYIDHWVRYCP